jgi:valyl-tRNA synthetase
LTNLQAALVGEMKKPRFAAGAITGKVETYVLLKDVLDFDAELKRLQKELSKLEKEYGLTQRKLSNEDFLGKAPPEVIEKEREKGSRLGEKMEKLRNQQQRVESLRNSSSTED